MKETPKVEIKDKILLTVEEAAAYSGKIGRAHV